MLIKEIEKKLVHDTESRQKKGVWQLSEAVQQLFGPRASKVIPEIDLENIQYVYLYIVTLDSIGGTIGISPFLNTFLEERLDRQAFPSLQIRPLFCSDIETLEKVTGYFAGSNLSQILEQWFVTNPSLATPLQVIDLDKFNWRENDWLHTEWKEICRNIVKILFPSIDPEVTLAAVLKRGQRRRRSQN